MTRLRRGALLAGLVLCCGGCAFMSDEDRDFYGKGWIHPSELDKPMEHHSTADPAEVADSNAAGAAAAPQPTPEWLVPQTRQ